MTVTVISTLYGTGYDRFVERWEASVAALSRQPDAVTIATPAMFGPCAWKHPQAFYQDAAIRHADTDWVWLLDIDDQALPDALDGLDRVKQDVWQMGFLISDGNDGYYPPQLTAKEFLKMDDNCLVGPSAFRREAYLDAGGFPDAALQDWGLWRRMAANGATFKASGRVHFRYQRHDGTRSKNELTLERRADHVQEALAAC